MFESIALGLVAAMERMDSMTVTGLFVVAMILLFVGALLMLARGRAIAFYESTPTLLTTLGILGTFLGIAIGLLEFDATRVESSIPLLLDGLKIAFTTSIVGILLSTCLRLALVLRRGRPLAADDAGEDATLPADASDLSTLFLRQSQLAEAQLATTRQLADQVAHLDERLIQTLEIQHAQHLDALRSFAEQLSEMGSRQLIAALESVIRDFNRNLGEQFGENFRRLDHSVEQLLLWQDQYREHMDALGQQLDLAIQGVASSQSSLQALTQQARQISTHIEDQEATMISLRREGMELESLLGSIAELRDKAREAFPAIDQRLKVMLETIENAVLAAIGTQQRLGNLGAEDGHFTSHRQEFAARAHA
ncbi:hypothetical protein [Thiocystis violascens]|uniref:MotA/TolQ/ExbB proton channel domain-containing protein n=1 Tax=Thiocystis violascens (strain ATCC 17096 / DSM 198 / 6111) TaxID=765911 RepID=I3Y601_THIV6|nr:hypothetical protein [Thiocystis violascens]AFL72419.1 hypothetical protein Thivi_0350 [Thiocystis violascens DSM 198]